MNDERAYWVAWNQLSGIGNIVIKRLFEHFSSLQAAWSASAEALSAIEGWSGSKMSELARQREQLDPYQLLKERECIWPPFWTPADPDYPPLLREIPDPPPVLFYRGVVRPWPATVAVVGTRRPSYYGLRWTGRIAGALARAGFMVISGLALGVDGAAHGAALDAGGPTTAVLGCGIDQVYPLEHQALAEQIAETGLILSEYPPGTAPLAAYFPRRNRIVAGMSLATIVIEAQTRSGALISANLACDYNREVYALPGSLDNPQAMGTLRLIQQGARAILSPEELLVELSSHLLRTVPPLAPAPHALPDLEDSEQQIWILLAQGVCSFDELLMQTGLPTGELASHLLMLELKGLIKQQAGSLYARGVSPGL